MPQPRLPQRGTSTLGTDRPDLHRQIRDSVILLPSRSRAHMQLCSTPAPTHNAWRRPAQQRSEHPPRLLYQRWNNRSHCSQVARWVEHIALRPVATDPAAGQCRPPQDECPPPVTQAPTTQGVEPDFFFWRAAGARRRSRAGRLREGKRPGQRSPSWPRASRLTVMLKPAAEVAGQPARGRGIASERRVARTWPASGGARAEPLPSEALGAPWRPMASLGPTALFQ